MNIGGDPTLLGWLTVIVYLLAAGLCWGCAWRARVIFGADFVAQHRLIWGGLTLGLLGLGINKQLDLQSGLTTVLRNIAISQGWYESGQQLQIIVLFLAGLLAIAGFIWLAYYLRHVWRHYWLLLFGLLFLARFIFVRVASFWGVPLPPLSQFTGGVQINWLLELVGAAVIGLAALINLWRGREKTAVSPAPPPTTYIHDSMTL